MNLADSFSLFLYAFKIKKHWFDTSDPIWRRSQLLPERDFLFDHVQDFFIKNSADMGTIIDESCCLRFELNRQNLSKPQKEKLMLINQLFSRTSQPGYMANDPMVKFKLIADGSVLSPAILYNPLTGICILSFSFSHSKETNTVQNVTDLNYEMRIFSLPDSPCFIVPRNEHPAALEQENKLSLALKNYGNELKPDDPRFHTWNIRTLINILLQDISPDDFIILSPNRLQIFSYLQTERKMSDVDLHIASFRLRRAYNYTYSPGAQFLEKTSETEQTFDQIHFGASIEGCVVIVNGDHDKLPPFLKDFSHVVKNRYIWSYLLAYYQRLAIIDMNDQLSHLYEDGQPDLNKLLKVSSSLSKIELRTLFTQVSFFSQHNDFYEFCKRNLKLGEMYNSINEKLADINRLLLEQLELEEKRRDIERANEQYIKEQNIMLEQKVDERTQELLAEKKKSDDLLLNILPAEVAEELKEKGRAAATYYDNVSVLFTDFANFTAATEKLSPQELIDELHTCFKAFDEIIGKYNIEKIKTIGDAYLAVCGLPAVNPHHARNAVSAAMEIRKFMANRIMMLNDKTFRVRIGVHSGSVVAGIVGVKKFAYDIWGDTVNTAARMEQNSEAGKINISEATYELVKDKFECTYRGEIKAKNKGHLKMYFVTQPKE